MSQEDYEEGDDLAVLLSSLDEIKASAASSEKHAILVSKGLGETSRTAERTEAAVQDLSNSVSNGLRGVSEQIQALREAIPQKRSKRATAAILASLIAFGACLGGAGVLFASRTATACPFLGGEWTVYRDDQIQLCAFQLLAN